MALSPLLLVPSICQSLPACGEAPLQPAMKRSIRSGVPPWGSDGSPPSAPASASIRRSQHTTELALLAASVNTSECALMLAGEGGASVNACRTRPSSLRYTTTIAQTSFSTEARIWYPWPRANPCLARCAKLAGATKRGPYISKQTLSRRFPQNPPPLLSHTGSSYPPRACTSCPPTRIPPVPPLILRGQYKLDT